MYVRFKWARISCLNRIRLNLESGSVSGTFTRYLPWYLKRMIEVLLHPHCHIPYPPFLQLSLLGDRFHLVPCIGSHLTDLRKEGKENIQMRNRYVEITAYWVREDIGLEVIR